MKSLRINCQLFLYHTKIYYYLKDLKQKQEEQKVCLGAAYHQTRVAIDNGRNKAKTIEENPDLINLKENGDFLSTDSSKVLFRIARDSCGIHFKYHNLRHPYVKHTTKKYNSEKQKTQATKMDLIAWVFRFCTFNYSKRSWTL